MLGRVVQLLPSGRYAKRNRLPALFGRLQRPAAVPASSHGAVGSVAPFSFPAARGNETPDSGTACPSHRVDHEFWVSQDLWYSVSFAGRSAEALEVLAANLRNTVALDAAALHATELAAAPFLTPVAGQTEGVGKTSLGRQLPAILRGPRGSPAAEAALADRLRQELDCGPWRAGMTFLEEALHDPQPENLVMRTLLAAFPGQRQLLAAFKTTQTVLIGSSRLRWWSSSVELDEAIARSMYCSGAVDYEAATKLEAAFRRLPAGERTAVGMAQALIRKRDGEPLFIVLDGVGSALRSVWPDKGAAPAGSTAALEQLRHFSSLLAGLHAVRGCFVYTTASPFMSAELAHLEAELQGRVRVQEIFMRPLQPDDVLQVMQVEFASRSSRGSLACEAGSGGSLAQDLSPLVPAELLPHAARAAVRVAGGVPQVTQAIIVAMAAEALRGGMPAPANKSLGLGHVKVPPSSEAEVDACVLEHASTWCAGRKAPLTHIWWDGPSAFAKLKTLPQWASSRTAVLGLLQLLLRAQLLGLQFKPDAAVTLPGVALEPDAAASRPDEALEPAPSAGRRPVRIRDAAMALHVPLRPAPGGTLSVAVGEFIARNIADAPLGLHRAPVTALLVKAMAAASACMQGQPTELLRGGMEARPLQLLCAEGILRSLSLRTGDQRQSKHELRQRHDGSATPPLPLAKALPFLQGTAAVQSGSPAKTHVQSEAVRVVALPVAVQADEPAGTAPQRLTAADRRALERERIVAGKLDGSRYENLVWRGSPFLNGTDLPWLLSSWLPINTLGVPVSAAAVQRRLLALRPAHTSAVSPAVVRACGHDLYLRVDGGVVAFAVHEALTWDSLAADLSAVPQLPLPVTTVNSCDDSIDNPAASATVSVHTAAPLSYTLVVVALQLPWQLQVALDGAASAVFGSGSWLPRLQASGEAGPLVKLAKVAASADISGGPVDSGAPRVWFTVPPNAELVIVNPRASGGLARLLGAQLVSQLAQTGGGRADYEVLDKWAAT